MRGDEARVVAAFIEWLSAAGWDVQEQVAFVDVAARRGAEQLYAEVKGRTASPGLDVDTLYGQLLRRMTAADPSVRFAVVVPSEALVAALRVPPHVRTALHIDVYEVADSGQVIPHC